MTRLGKRRPIWACYEAVVKKVLARALDGAIPHQLWMILAFGVPVFGSRSLWASWT